MGGTTRHLRDSGRFLDEAWHLGAGAPRISIGARGYTTGFAASKSGRLAGPWEQSEPLYADDGGHPMVFRRFDGQLMLTLHSPNNSPLTRQRLFELEDTGDSLRLKTR